MPLPLTFDRIIGICLFLITGMNIADSQTLIPYLDKNGRYGFVSESGEKVIKPQFERPDQFFESGKLSLHLRKDGQPVVLLRNGQLLTGSDLTHEAWPVINVSGDGGELDSFTHLLGLVYADSIRIYHNNRQIHKDYLHPSKAGNPYWFLEDPESLVGNPPIFKYIHGSFAVWKSRGKLNFLDEQLKEIFSRDFTAGMVADAQYFIVADGPGQFALADRKGKIRTPFIYHRISRTGIPGYFIVNNPSDPSEVSGSHAGLINGKGKIVIDTVYHTFTHARGTDLFIVKKGDHYGVLNMDGKIIISVDKPIITFLPEARNFQVGAGPGHILDLAGQPVFAEPFQQFGKRQDNGFGYYVMSHGDTNKTIQVFDLHLNPLATFNGIDELELLQKNPVRFKVHHISGTRKMVQLWDDKGKSLTGNDYQAIYSLVPIEGFFRVVKNGLSGVINANGQEIIPSNFEELQIEIVEGDTLMWVRKKDSGFWTAYTMRGDPVPTDKKISPSLKKDPVIAIFAKGDAHFQVTFKDGRIKPLPDSLKNWTITQQYTTSEGGILQWQRTNPQSGIKENLWLNHKMEPFIPRGYFVPESFHSDRHLAASGLLTVYRKRASSAKNSQNNQGNKGTEINYPDSNQAPEEIDACGVINANGEWMIPPKQQVRYITLSRDVVAEIPLNETLKPGEKNKFPIRLLAVNLPGRPSLPVDYVEYDQFGSDKQTMRIGIADEKKRYILLGYLHASGKQLTPFHVIQGPGYLKDRNLITIAPEGDFKKTRQQIIDKSGKIIADLDSLYCPDIAYNGNADRSSDYFVVQRLFTPEQTAELESKSNEDRDLYLSTYRPYQGVMDSSGSIVIPVQYRNLQIIKTHRIISAIDSLDRHVLYTWSGSPVYTFQNHVESKQSLNPLQIKALPNGSLFVADQNVAVVLNPDNQVVREIPYPFYSLFSASHPYYYLASDAQKHIYWVDMQTGKAFKD